MSLMELHSYLRCGSPFLCPWSVLGALFWFRSDATEVALVLMFTSPLPLLLRQFESMSRPPGIQPHPSPSSPPSPTTKDLTRRRRLRCAPRAPSPASSSSTRPDPTNTSQSRHLSSLRPALAASHLTRHESRVTRASANTNTNANTYALALMQ